MARATQTNENAHDAKLAAIQAWFASLEPGIADMEIGTPPNDKDWTHVRIRPIRTPNAAAILLRVSQSDGVVFLYAGVLRFEDPSDWPELTCLTACQAIMAGGLTDTVRLWRGQEVGRRTCLRMPNNGEQYCENELGGLGEIARIVLGTVLGGKEQRVIQYPPD